jgi:hypothetical protein
MTLVVNKEEHSGYLGTLCHVCSKDFKQEDKIIEHTGQVFRFPLTEGLGCIVLHEECATVLILRLAADVMRVDKVPRVVDKLALIREHI